ncbi:MAG: ATP-dependent DNA helicase [Candidatus Nomurabacteria bacterium]|nr:ATP-dependent DNA helicase [Candidatus Nomurabacteria bacterium]
MSDILLDFEKAHKNLNKAQKEAVDTIDGPVMVVAGPGSGKTQILSLRVANILKQTDTPPHGILCLTFTEAGAINMLNRLKTMIGVEAYKVNIFTFHAFGTNIISRYPEYFFSHARLSPADELIQREIITEILKSLDHKNPYSSFHINEGYVFLKDILSRISQIKKAGITPKEFDLIISNNKITLENINSSLSMVFKDRLSTKIFPEIKKMITQWENIDTSSFPSDYFKPISGYLISSLKKALEESVSENKTGPIGEWKKKYTTGTNENIVLKSFEAGEKLENLGFIYSKYKDMLFERGYFDYDDMILEVIEAIRKNENLKAELQEQFLYTMVDEFQDTNDAQIRLIRLLTDNPVNEKKPNIMVVGDDDQAIYRFQGADISNIKDFHLVYESVKIIVMTENYRSGQNILDLARTIIVTGSNRLEDIIEGINKKLISSGDENKNYTGEIKKLKYKTKEHQYHNIALKIKNLIKEGHNPKDIAVISRKHRELENLVPFMHYFSVPIVYEKEQNVLATPHIHQLITMCKYLNIMESESPYSGDSLMPEILSYPFWGLSYKTIWDISLLAKTKRDDKSLDTSWLSVMLDYKDEKVVKIAEFFIEMSARSKYEPVEYVLESLIGKSDLKLTDDEFEETENNNVDKFISPYKDYYFSKEKLEKNKPEYLRFLSGLKFFIGALRGHSLNSLLKVSDLVKFVEIHESSHILLNDTSPFTGAENAVQLMSAHKSKGLEFETVFLLSCQDENWSKGGMRNKIRLPENLPIDLSSDESDDDLRLFYVALTRAKKNLYLSTYLFKDDGGESVEVKFLNNNLVLDSKDNQDEDLNTSSILETTTPNYTDKVYIESEKAFLAPLVENYKLSVSHFNNYLNIYYGEGPKTFFEQNLIRFPQPMSISNIFGSSIHKSIELCIIKYKEKGILPSKEEFINLFENDFKRKRISEMEMEKYLARGKEALSIFYDIKLKEILPTDKTEVDFGKEGVVLDKAHITGKIDLLRILDGNIVDVFDFKTGKAIAEKNKDEKDKIKEWSYKNQIIFYKLLIENSKNYKNYKMNNGIFIFVEPEIYNGATSINEKQIEFTDEEVARTRKLIEIIFNKINNLDFVNIDKYPKTLKGINQFEEDLLAGKI